MTPPPFGGFIVAASPDAHFVAYTSIESGQQELYVRTFSPDSPNAGGKWQISNGQARHYYGASWRAEGQRFLATITTGEPESPAENIVVNWMATVPGRR